MEESARRDVVWLMHDLPRRRPEIANRSSLALSTIASSCTTSAVAIVNRSSSMNSSWRSTSGLEAARDREQAAGPHHVRHAVDRAECSGVLAYVL
jgi:hypothetical protein